MAEAEAERAGAKRRASPSPPPPLMASSAEQVGMRRRRTTSPSMDHHAGPAPITKAPAPTGPATMYLDTIDRSLLDFDFERLCSVSLSNLNCYACLVCGRYYSGRGPSTHAYAHALNVDHHVFIHLETLKVYILPEGHEVKDPSLSDIQYVIHPTYTARQIGELDKKAAVALDLQGKAYLPGFMGLNNIKANDYINVVIQALNQVRPLRDFFLANPPAIQGHSELVKRLGIVIRKLWNPRAFKPHVSPHELLQEIVKASQKRFTLTEQADSAEFLAWFLNTLHLGMGGKRGRTGSSLIHHTFQGELRIETLRDGQPSGPVTTSPFLVLTLNLPPAPLFQAEVEKCVIPQVPLLDLLRKYDGVTVTEGPEVSRRYQLTRLPRYLIFQLTRFTKNNWTREKNRTIVNFPIKGMDMRDYLAPEVQAAHAGSTVYDLLANISHEGDLPAAGAQGKRASSAPADNMGVGAGAGVFRVHLHYKPTDTWYEMQDLLVTEIMPQMIFLSETYLMVWERREPAGGGSS